MISRLTAELARRLRRKSTVLIAVTLAFWFVLMAPDLPMWSLQWWAQVMIGTYLWVIIFAAWSDRQYAQRVLAEPKAKAGV